MKCCRMFVSCMLKEHTNRTKNKTHKPIFVRECTWIQQEQRAEQRKALIVEQLKQEFHRNHFIELTKDTPARNPVNAGEPLSPLRCSVVCKLCGSWHKSHMQQGTKRPQIGLTDTKRKSLRVKKRRPKRRTEQGDELQKEEEPPKEEADSCQAKASKKKANFVNKPKRLTFNLCPT